MMLGFVPQPNLQDRAIALQERRSQYQIITFFQRFQRACHPFRYHTLIQFSSMSYMESKTPGIPGNANIIAMSANSGSNTGQYNQVTTEKLARPYIEILPKYRVTSNEFSQRDSTRDALTNPVNAEPNPINFNCSMKTDFPDGSIYTTGLLFPYK